MTSTPSTSAAPTLGARLRWFFTLDNRFLAPLLVTCILLVGEFSYGMLESWNKLFLSIGTSVAVELLLGRATLGKWPHLASAYISGISVGILIRSPFFWPYALCAALATMSKYVLRWRGRHLWNPSNLGISVMLLLYPAAVATLSIQWGNTLIPMVVVWGLGSAIIYRLRRFHICVAYVASFLVLSWVRSRLTGTPWLADVAPITGPMYQLFIFFMITDPKTTVRSWKGQCLVASLIAVVEAALRLAGIVDAPYYALFMVGPLANIVDLSLFSPLPAASAATRPRPA